MTHRLNNDEEWKMPQLDRLKEELGLQKQLFFAAVGLFLGLSGWLATNVQIVNWFLLTCGLVVVGGRAVFAYTRYKRMYQLLQDIEDA